MTEEKAEKKDEPRFIRVGGDTYRLAPRLEGADLVAVRNHITTRSPSPLTAVAEDPGFKLLPPDLQTVACNRAVDLAAGGGASVTPEGATRILMRPEGVAFVIWLLTRRNHPGLRWESIRPHVNDDNCELLFAEVSGLVDLDAQARTVEEALAGKAPAG